MKKSLLLIALLGSSGAVLAQSNVTLFGIVDATLAYGKGSIADKTQLHRGGLATNRIGFRGVEDLGGGLKASFWLESGIYVDEGTGTGSNTNNQASGATAGSGLTFGRRSTLSLAGNWGEVRLGRDIVPAYHNMSRGDPFSNVGVGQAVNYTAMITGVTGVRASNMVSYLTPNLAGLTLQVSHYRGENPKNAPNADDGTGNGIQALYAQGPLQLSAGWGRTQYADGDVLQRTVYAAWDFKAARLMATYNNDRAGARHAQGVMVGAVVPVGPHQLRGSYSVHRRSDGAQQEGKKIALGYVHNLSKRTAAYATWARISNGNGASLALNGAATAMNRSSSGVDLGIRHSF